MSEHNEQCALIAWAAYHEPQIPELRMLYAIPNGGHRHKATAAKLKAEGVKAGVFDLSLDVARGVYYSLKIEMKWGKNKLSDDQKEWMKRYYKYGHLPVVCWSWEDAKQAILQYLALEDGQDWAGNS